MELVHLILILVSSLIPLLLNEDELRSVGVLQYPLEVHGLIQLVLRLYHLLEEEVIMALFEDFDVDVLVVVSKVKNKCVNT